MTVAPAFAAALATAIRAPAILAAIALAASVTPAAAQQCGAAPGGPGCEIAGGIAGMGDPDGSDLAVGNPIHPITGNKYQEELDAPPLPGLYGLEIRRHFNSSYAAANGPWGRGWALSYETRVYRSGSNLQIIQADGRRLAFKAPDAGVTAAAGTGTVACAAGASGQGQLFMEAYGYRWSWPQQRELRFDHAGQLTQIRPLGGGDAEGVRIDRGDDGRIRQVTDPAGRRMDFHYDRNGNLSRIDHPLGSWDYRFDASGRMSSVTSPEGVSRQYRYDDAAHPLLFTSISIVAPGELPQVIGRWSFDADGRADGYRRGDGSGLSLSYRQPGSSPLETVSVITNALGGRTLFRAVELAGKWRVTEIRGPGCEECGPTNVRMRYDLQGRLLARWKIGGGGFAYQRDRQGRIVKIFSIPRPEAHAFAGGRSRASSPGPLAYVQRFEYPDDEAHLPRLIARPSVVPGREHRVVLDRDGRGNLIRFLESGHAPPGRNQADATPVPLAREFRLAYEEIAGRRVLAELDGPLPNGPAGEPADSDITRWRYDENGRFPMATQTPHGQWRFPERDPGGRPTVVVFADGHREVTQHHVYDLHGRILQTRSIARRLDDGAGLVPKEIVQQWTRAFDAQGRLVGSTDVAGRSLHYGRDAAGRLRSIGDGAGYRTELTRDAEGQVLVAALHQPGQEGLLRAVHYRREADGRLRSILLADGRHLRFHYAASGVATAFTDADGLLRPVQPSAARRGSSPMIDDFGQVIEQSLADHGARRMRFDPAGRLLEVEDALGNRIIYRHDPAGRLLSRAVSAASGAAGHLATYRWEGLLLTGVDDPAQVVRYQRDAAGRVVMTRTRLAGLEGPPLMTSTAHDPTTGFAVGHGLAGGQSLQVRPGAAGEGGAMRVQLRDAFWTAVAARLHQVLPAGVAGMVDDLVPRTDVARAIDVNPFNGLAGFTHGNGSRMQRHFDLAGRTVRLESGPAPAAHWRYGFGVGPRIRSIRSLDESQSPGTRQDAAKTYDYDRRGAMMTEGQNAILPAGGLQPALARDGPAALERDAAGRVTVAAGLRFAYGAFGQIEEARDLQHGRLVATYVYNHRGQRTRKTVHLEGGQTTVRYYLWDADRLAAEIAPDGKVLAQYLYLDDGRRSLPLAKLQSTGADRHGSRLLAIHADHRGAPVAMSDGQQRTVWRAEISSTGLADIKETHDGAEMNIRLPGQFADPETGLHDNWHRTYDPHSGRYLQPDPLGYPDGPDPYAYAGGDPVNRADPLGLYEIDVHYYMTLFLGVTAGLDPQEARIVALAAQYVDDNPLTRPVDGTSLGSTIGSVLRNQQQLLGYHFVLSGSDGRTLPAYRNDHLGLGDSPQLQNLLNAANSSGIGRHASLQFLGEYLHALADTYSHRDAENIPYDALIATCGVGHGHALHEPDLTYDDIHHPSLPGDDGQPPVRQTWRREPRTLAMEFRLHGVLLGYGDPAKARQAQEIEAVLREFNAIRESESGGSDLGRKIALLQSSLVRLGLPSLDLGSEDGFGYSERDARSNRATFLRDEATGEPLREEDFPGTCLEGGTRCATR